MSDFIKLDKAFSKRNTFTVFPGEDSFEFSVSVNDIDFLKPEFELNYFSKSAIDEETRNNWIKSCLKELRTDDVKECPFYYRTSGDSFVLVCKFEDEPIEIYDFLIRRKGIV